jgi:methylthioribose-1-phosphate isomerase
MRTIEWRGDHVETWDQTLLPQVRRRIRLRTVDDLVDAIKRLAIRGAPALGAAGALGVLLAARTSAADGYDPDRVRAEAERLARARPTAVNLRWAVERLLPDVDRGVEAVERSALALLDADAEANEALSRRGASLVRELLGDRPVTIHTHCNAGALACVDWGTALGIVRALHEDGRIREVLVGETRPLLQGARITASELSGLDVPYRVCVDGAGASAILGGLVDAVIVGADRVAANGDVANKIGTLPLALAAARAGIPFLVAAPESTLDAATATGAEIEIEERASGEVLSFAGTRITPEGARVLNPAFDVTPADLVTAIITERRTIYPSLPAR